MLLGLMSRFLLRHLNCRVRTWCKQHESMGGLWKRLCQQVPLKGLCSKLNLCYRNSAFVFFIIRTKKFCSLLFLTATFIGNLNFLLLLFILFAIFNYIYISYINFKDLKPLFTSYVLLLNI